MIRSFVCILWLTSALALAQKPTLSVGLDPLQLYHNVYGARTVAPGLLLHYQTPTDLAYALVAGIGTYRLQPDASGSTYHSSGFFVKPIALYRIYPTLSLGGGLFAAFFSESYTYDIPGSSSYAGTERKLQAKSQMMAGLEMTLLYTYYRRHWGLGIMPRMSFTMMRPAEEKLQAQGALLLDEDQNTFPHSYIPGLGLENASKLLYPSLQVFIMWRQDTR